MINSTYTTYSETVHTHARRAAGPWADGAYAINYGILWLRNLRWHDDVIPKRFPIIPASACYSRFQKKFPIILKEITA